MKISVREREEKPNQGALITPSCTKYNMGTFVELLESVNRQLPTAGRGGEHTHTPGPYLTAGQSLWCIDIIQYREAKLTFS